MATTACVNWPQRWEDSGEGGLVVYFVVVENYDDPFVQCYYESAPTMAYPDVIVSGHRDEVWPERRGDSLPESGDLLAVVCVASTTASWCDPDTGIYFAVTTADLTDHGKQLYNNLQALYGREVLIITLLDT